MGEGTYFIYENRTIKNLKISKQKQGDCDSLKKKSKEKYTCVENYEDSKVVQNMNTCKENIRHLQRKCNN